MSSEPILSFLRKQPVCHPLELPDTESFLEQGRLSYSPFLRGRSKPFRSSLKNSLAQAMVREISLPLYRGMRRHPKLATRLRCRALSFLAREDHLEAARYLVSEGRYREEVQAGLLYLLFLGEAQDLESARILARNEAFTPYAVGLIARFSSDRDAELRELLTHLKGSEKRSVTELLLKNPTPENVDAALRDGFPELTLPIWYWRWRDDDLLEELWRLWRPSAKLWMQSPRLQQALLTQPQMAARAAYVCEDDSFIFRVLLGPVSLEHLILDKSAAADWTPYILEALDDEDDFQWRQGWVAARLLGWDLDALLESRKPHVNDYVAWEECVPYLKRVGALEQFAWTQSDGEPCFELGLCPKRWAPARSFEAVLRGISAFPGTRADLVRSGLRHSVISVRLAALGVAAVWPDDTFLEEVLKSCEGDPVPVVREQATLVAGRGPLEPERRFSLQQALQKIGAVPEHLIEQFLDAPVLEQYETQEHEVTYVRFVDGLNQRSGWTYPYDHTEQGWVVCLDSRRRHLLWAERV